jgi:alkanesulfonate monooxygenase SsuD/methylene tetrahydromethanopterin reductase-like flavin-dependent oxidoreductase (luciferase family)
MKFGVDVPTCLAGMAYPIPLTTADEVIQIAVEAVQLGYHEVAGNDHLSTQRFVREAWSVPPDYFEPLMTLSAIAAKTSVVRLAAGILVLPMRDPVLLAKQVATLDHISGAVSRWQWPPAAIVTNSKVSHPIWPMHREPS